MTLLFPDVSSYTPDVDPARYPILIARATLSDRVADPTYQTFKAKAAAAGTLFAAYHWLNHGNLTRQAAWCFRHVGPGVPVMIDAEDVAGNTGYNGPLTVDDLIGFAAEYRKLGGTVSLAYLPFWYWSGAMAAPHTLDQLTAAGLHLVSSNYPNAGYTENGPGWAPYYPGAPVPVQWQYTSTPIDMNAYRGTVQEYADLIGIPRVEAESIQKETTMFLARGNDPADTTVYLCDGHRSRPLTAQQLADLVALWETGALDLMTGDGNTASMATDWLDYGGHPRLIRTGWYEGAFGPLDAGVELTDAQLDALAAKVAALLPAQAAVPTASEIAKAVNDDAAARLQN
jgi:hypothetical protein